MPSNISVSLGLTGEGKITGTAGLTTPSAQLGIGSGLWPAMNLALTFGTAAQQAKNWFRDVRTILAGANDDLDLSGSLTNELGESLLFTSIKLLLIAIDAPDGTKKLRVGPQGVANAFQGPFGGVTSVCYEELTNWKVFINDPWTGYTVTAGTADVLRINNPGAGSVTYRILAAGLTP